MRDSSICQHDLGELKFGVENRHLLAGSMQYAANLRIFIKIFITSDPGTTEILKVSVWIIEIKLKMIKAQKKKGKQAIQ